MPAYPSRVQEFGYGLSGSQASPIGIERNSVLMPFMHSPNGMSPREVPRQTPFGQMPSSNGYAQSTYSQLYPTGLETKAY